MPISATYKGSGKPTGKALEGMDGWVDMRRDRVPEDEDGDDDEDDEEEDDDKVDGDKGKGPETKK